MKNTIKVAHKKAGAKLRDAKKGNCATRRTGIITPHYYEKLIWLFNFFDIIQHE
jgi:hypothetical protein